MSRPTLGRPDFTLRLFIDTNIIIDCLEKNPENESLPFIESLKDNSHEFIEIVSSDCVLWELYDYIRGEYYAETMYPGWSFKKVKSGLKEFKGIDETSIREMRAFIDSKVDALLDVDMASIITFENAMISDISEFYHFVKTLLQTSKFSREDAIVVVSAILASAHILITMDRQFHGEGTSRAPMLKSEFESLSIDWKIDFKSPRELTATDGILKMYKEWFMETNRDKIIGNVTKVYSQASVICVECISDYCLKVGDYVCIIKFKEDSTMIKEVFKIEQNNLQDYVSTEKIESGSYVTISVPSLTFSQEFTNAKVYINEF